MPVVNVEKIMGAVRMAMLKRKLDSSAPGYDGNDQLKGAVPPAWQGVRAFSAEKSEYCLGELLAFSDREFVENAYRVILRRATDPEGLAYFLERLRAGVLSKVEVLGQLRWSNEGVGRGVHVDGLLVPYALRKLMRRAFVGPIVRWLYGACRLGTAAERLEGQEARLGYAIEALGSHANRISLHLASQIETHEAELHRLSGVRDHVMGLEAGVEELRSIVDSVKLEARDMASRLEEVGAEIPARIKDATEPRLRSLEEALRGAVAVLDALVARIDRIEADLPAIDEKVVSFQSLIVRKFENIASDIELHIRTIAQPRLDALEEAFSNSAAAIDAIGSRLDRVERGLPVIDERFEDLKTDVASRFDDEVSRFARHMEDQVATVSSKVASLSPQVEELIPRVAAIEKPLLARERASQMLDSLYVAFEREFRGSKELIESRAEPYLEVLREANVGGTNQPVLDIGPGNGEWLDLLRRNGFTASGVDSNHLFVELCTGRGLKVEHADALEYLRQVPNGSLGAITALHVVEHISFEVLVELLDEARRALCIGGVIALETPNPENLLVGSHYFYTDPTHRNPIPPETLRWIVEARGFERCRIERWTVARDLPVPAMLAGNTKPAKAVNEILAHLSAAPDYAVIGRRL